MPLDVHVVCSMAAHVCFFLKFRVEGLSIRPIERPVLRLAQTHRAVGFVVDFFQVFKAKLPGRLELRGIGRAGQMSSFRDAVVFGFRPFLAVLGIQTEALCALAVQQSPTLTAFRSRRDRT